MPLCGKNRAIGSEHGCSVGALLNLLDGGCGPFAVRFDRIGHGGPSPRGIRECAKRNTQEPLSAGVGIWKFSAVDIDLQGVQHLLGQGQRPVSLLAHAHIRLFSIRLEQMDVLGLLG
jgi:hypothetical protein